MRKIVAGKLQTGADFEGTMQECFACFMDMKYKNVISNTK